MKTIFLTSAAAALLAAAAITGPATAADRGAKISGIEKQDVATTDVSARRRHYRGYRYGYRRYPRYYYGGSPYYGGYGYASGPYYGYYRPYYRPFPFGGFPFF